MGKGIALARAHRRKAKAARRLGPESEVLSAASVGPAPVAGTPAREVDDANSGRPAGAAVPDRSRPTTSDTPRAFGRLPALDGLRAIAVLAVLVYHADLNLLPGGFLGVDVFFVISGYLITALLLAEWSSTGGIAVRSFWLRRARRLLPAVFAMLAIVIAFAVLVVPGEVARLRSDALASFGYVTNWYLILQHQSYFEAVGRPSPLRHLWSLAVEEQFYLLWPLVLVAGLAVLRRRLLVVGIVLLAALSAAWMALLYVPQADPSRVYYGTDTRLAPLLLGAALAFVWVPRRGSVAQALTRRRVVVRALAADGLVAVGLAGLVAAFVLLDDAEPFLYQGGFVLVALLTAVVVAAAVHPASVVGRRLLETRLMRWIGERSYSIYLWHWPVFVLTRPQLDVPLDAVPDFVPRLVLTFALAEASYRFVESPIRRGALGRLCNRWQAQLEAGMRLRQRLAATAAGGVARVLVLILTVEVAGANTPPPPAYLAVPSVEGVVTADSSSTPSGTPAPVVAQPSAGQATVPPSASRRPVMSPVAAGPGTSETPRPRYGAPVLAIGDSLIIGAVPQLAHLLGHIEVDAEVGRSFQGAIGIVEARQAARTLPPTVIIDLGNNGRFYPSDFDRMMKALRDVRLVVFVNLKVPRAWESPNNQELAAGVKKYANAVLVDWHAASSDRPTLFWDDGIHLRPQGAQVYAALVAKAVEGADGTAEP